MAESFDRVLHEREPSAFDASSLSDAAKASSQAVVESSVAPHPHTFWIGAVAVAALAGSAYNSFGDGANRQWHFTNEGWLGQNTYAGGGDKASHVVSYYAVGMLLGGAYQELGMQRDNAALLGAATSTMAGFVTELGDGRGLYGFSYEDLLMDTLGAATYLGISYYHLDDLVSLSAGLVPIPSYPCCVAGAFGKDYTEEIYAANLKIAGLGDRMHFRPGPARFLLFSVSYSAKGYPYADPDIRERQVGFSLGINFSQILKEVGVPPDKLWGKVLYFLFDVLRIPYTQVGMFYDLNSGHWHGPGIGDTWYTGSPGSSAAGGAARVRFRR